MRRYSVLTEADKDMLRQQGIDPPLTQDDLPYSDGKPLDNERHGLQMELLFEPLRLYWRDRDDAYVGMNQFLYFSLERVRNEQVLGPDIYVVVGVPKRERLSWVVWEEHKPPDAVIEILSSTTKRRDQAEKKRIYQNEAKIPEYYWHDPDTGLSAGFRLTNEEYQPLAPDSAGRLVSEHLGLTLVRWHGPYRDVTAPWMRWATPDGTLLPTGAELAEAAERRAEAERLRARTAQEQAEAERLRAEAARERAAAAERQLAARLAELERYRARFGPLGDSDSSTGQA